MTSPQGHAFVVQGDLTQLVCDEVLIPTDRWLDVGRHWDSLMPLRERDHLPAGWSTGTVRVTARLPPVEGLPARRMVNSGASEHDPAGWLLEGVDQALAAAVTGLSGSTSTVQRALPLLALPVLGTGAGGFASRRGEVLDGLLSRCQQMALDSGVDIAVVCHDRSDLTAVQARRSQLTRPPASPLARRLGRLARQGGLALFLGAGVSVGAGLPGWASLLSKLAESDPRTHDLPKAWLAQGDLWQRASELQAVLGDEGMAAAVRSVLSQRRFALSHALLASLPGKEVVTTNFDGLFESARSVRTVPKLELLPYVRGGEAYLLKLHGDARLGDVVLSRESLEAFEVQRRPLAGLLQGLLLTRHLLFVGCSMQDENVQRTIDEVAALVKQHGHDGPVGTILLLTADAEVKADWEAKGFAVEAVSEADERTAARALEVLLDEVLLEATYDEGAHLLDPTYAALLDPQESDAAAVLRAAAALVPAGAQWAGLRQALQAHGAPVTPH